MRTAGYIVRGFRKVGYLNVSIYSGETFYAVLCDGTHEFESMDEFNTWLQSNRLRYKEVRE